MSAVGAIGKVGKLAVTSGALAASATAVSKLVACVGLGYWAADVGVLDPASCATLSRLIFAIFQPALLLVNVASTLASPTESISTLALIPAFALAQITLGAVVGSLVVRALRLNPKTVDGRELRMSCSFANSGPLPLLFADALFRTSADRTLAPRAVAFISFYLLGWSPAFWTVGRNMLSPPSSGSDSGERSEKPPLVSKARLQLVLSNPQTKRILSPPVMGCLLGAIIGGVPILRKTFLGSTAPLRPITDSLSTLGQAYLPAVILTLAGTLHQVLNAGKARSTTDTGAAAAAAATAGSTSSSSPYKREGVSLATKVGALSLARFVAMPLAGLGLLAAGTRIGFIPRNDPLLRFILLMEACMPSAQNSVVILQLDKDVEGAGSMAKTLSALYITAVLPIAILLSLSSMHAGLI